MALKSIEGLPIYDATKSIKITVRPLDVAHGGSRREPETCVIARACKRDMGATKVFVHLSRVYVRNGGASYTRYMMSGALRTEVIAWDRGGRFQAGEFVLMKPYKSAKLGAERARKIRRTGPKTSKLVPQYILEGVRERPLSGE